MSTATLETGFTMPVCDVAAGLLLRIASPLFHKAIHLSKLPGAEGAEPNFQSWSELRHVAERFLATRTAALDEKEAVRLLSLLVRAHLLNHALPAPDEPDSIGFCSCSMAENIRLLSDLLKLRG